MIKDIFEPLLRNQKDSLDILYWLQRSSYINIWILLVKRTKLFFEIKLNGKLMTIGQTLLYPISVVIVHRFFFYLNSKSFFEKYI